MHIKVYFGDKPVYLCTQINPAIQEILQHPDAVFVDEISTPAINSLLHEIKKEEFHAGVLLHPDLPLLQKQLFKHFTAIEAAGGLVANKKEEYLFIHRLGKWDLPKGKMEHGETAAESAMREVEEETGVTHLKIVKPLAPTYHTYDAFGKHFIKTTHWFLMQCKGEQHTQPQIEENITAIAWFGATQFQEPLQNTYPSIKDVIAEITNA
jgi:8-oxo-dGTP pyrophosphatase MutT (NUDIX family)